MAVKYELFVHYLSTYIHAIHKHFFHVINVTFKAKDKPDFNALHFAQAHNIYYRGKKMRYSLLLLYWSFLNKPVK